MKIEMWPIDKVIPYARNARKIPQAAIDKVAASIREFGWQQPIVVGNDRVVVAGHVRLLAAKQLDEKKVPVTVASELTPGQLKAYRLMDNRSHEEATWDMDLLTPELSELRASGLELGLTGFDAAEIATFLAGSPGELPPQAEDEIPAVQPVVFTQPGDMWLLGRHRLLCGDCRDAAVVARLFEASKASVAITSPPYASQRAYDPSSGFVPIPPDQYSEWFRKVAENISAVLAPDGSYFLNIKAHADDGERSLYVMDLVLAHKRVWNWMFVDEFCWRKTDNGVPGEWPNRFKNAWEPVFQFAKVAAIKFRPEDVSHYSELVMQPGSGQGHHSGGHRMDGSVTVYTGANAARKSGMARPSNVVEVRSETGQGQHSAPFPRALVEFFVKGFSDAGDVVFDPFMGSGTSMMAAEVNGRIGYGTEISARYCDVIVRRYEALTGQRAKLEDGRTFEQLQQEASVAA